MSRKLILPEDIIFELMDMTATLGEVAQEYQRKIGNDKDIDEILSVYHRIIKRLMDLQDFEEFGKETVTLDELVHGAGLSYLGEVR
jgi:hypothetical protein|tara:strand:+ start:971 stop:1228 length:258 start_codon:yes stop_codon:yes gene_type:complete